MRGKNVASLAALSAMSFSCIPMWFGFHMQGICWCVLDDEWGRT